MAVAVDRVHGFKPFSRPPRCKLSSFTQLDYYKMFELTQSKLAKSLENAFKNIHKSFSTPCLSHSSRVRDDTDSRIEIIIGRGAPRVRSLVVEVTIAMASGINPEPTSSGLGGAYFLRAQNGEKIAVAKPIDEEPLAFNNPKGLAGRTFGQPGMKSSIRIGETGIRESAAYLLDHEGFSGVPPTALVKFSNVTFNSSKMGSSDPDSSFKIASLQRFVIHDSDAGDVGPSSFSVASVHQIGILDVRLMNLDRHAGNILVRHGRDGYAKAELAPIDHGFCLPESLDDPYFEWLHWPQASIPFSESEVEYISKLDPFSDAELLRTEIPSMRESSVRVLVLCTIFLKRATECGLCLADIGEMMTREFRGGEENWSTLEGLCLKAMACLNNGVSSPLNDANETCRDPEEADDADDHEDDMFRFEDENEDDEDGFNIDATQTLLNSPMQGKPSKIPRFSSLSAIDDFASSPFNGNAGSCIDNDHTCKKSSDNCDGNEDGNSDDNPKTTGLMRSVSYPAPSYNSEGQYVSFGYMDDEMWRSFLDIFEQVLPHAFEERKSTGLSRQRLGSSCEF